MTSSLDVGLTSGPSLFARNGGLCHTSMHPKVHQQKPKQSPKSRGPKNGAATTSHGLATAIPPELQFTLAYGRKGKNGLPLS